MHYSSIFNHAAVVFFVNQARKTREEFKNLRKSNDCYYMFYLGFLIWFGIALVIKKIVLNDKRRI